MVKRSIKWTQTAAKQRHLILAYWVERTGSSEYSVKLLNLVRERIQYLVEHPLSGQKADFPETRVVSLGHYSIYFTRYAMMSLSLQSFGIIGKILKSFISCLLPKNSTSRYSHRMSVTCWINRSNSIQSSDDCSSTLK